MTRVLLLGYDSEAVDFSNPALPGPGHPRLLRACLHGSVASCALLDQFQGDPLRWQQRDDELVCHGLGTCT